MVNWDLSALQFEAGSTILSTIASLIGIYQYGVQSTDYHSTQILAYDLGSKKT